MKRIIRIIEWYVQFFGGLPQGQREFELSLQECVIRRRPKGWGGFYMRRYGVVWFSKMLKSFYLPHMQYRLPRTGALYRAIFCDAPEPYWHKTPVDVPVAVAMMVMKGVLS